MALHSPVSGVGLPWGLVHTVCGVPSMLWVSSASSGRGLAVYAEVAEQVLDVLGVRATSEHHREAPMRHN